AFGAARAFLAARLAARLPAQTSGLGARHEAVALRHVVVVCNDDAAHRVDGDAAPVGTAVVAGILNPLPIRRRRRVDSVVHGVTELNTADELIDRRDAPHVAFRQIAFRERVIARERLRRRTALGLDAALRHGALLDADARLARTAIEHVEVTLLARPDDRRHARAVAARKVDERALGSQVVVPDVDVHGLEMPGYAPRLGVERDERRRVFVL